MRVMIVKILREIGSSGHMPELLVSTVVVNLLGLGSALYSINVLNRYLSSGITLTLVTLTVGALIALLFEALLKHQRHRVLDGVSKGIDTANSQRTFKAFVDSSYAALTGVPLAERREALAAAGAQQQLQSHGNLAALLDLPFALVFIVAVGLLYTPMALWTGLFCAFVLFLGVLNERRARGPAEQHGKAQGKAQQIGQFVLASGEALRALPMRGPLEKRWKALQNDALDSRRLSMFMQLGLQSNIQSVGQVLTVAVYAIGAMAAARGDISTGALIGCSILATRAFGVCSRAASLVDPLVRAERAEAALRKTESLTASTSADFTPGQPDGSFELHDVAFAYPGAPMPVFESVNLRLAPGQVLVVCGPNGSGKSTLLKLMLGVLRPDRGVVRANGLELGQISLPWWHQHSGYLPQEPTFFDGTLRENVVLDRPVADADLLALLTSLGLEQFLANDPQGLDRPVLSHDTGLAVGIRRRLALARAILTGPRTIFLDEPTEGLDTAGQAAMAGLLNTLVKQGKTLVIASNEPFVQRAADFVCDLTAKPIPQLKARSE